MSDVKHYKCTSCGAPINFVPGTDTLVCEYCGASVPVSDLLKEEKNAKSFDWTAYAPEELTATPDKEYVCASCGATLQSFDSQFVTYCPYCGNNVSALEETKGGMSPNLIIPFNIKKEEVKPKIREYLKTKKLLPKSFLKVAMNADVKGVYVPFWLFDCEAEGEISLHGERSVSESFTNDKGETETREKTLHYRLEREGHFELNKLPVDASTHFDNKAMDALEPFNYSQLTDFSDVYFTGYLAEKFNSTPDDEMQRTKRKIQEGITDFFRETERKYSNIRIIEDNTDVKIDNIKYAMLPVYTLNFNYGDSKRQLFMNGQSGKIIGDLPVKKAKAFTWFLGTFTVVLAICSLVSFLI